MDEKERYKLYRERNARCHYCGTRLQWDAFEVRGLSGAWVVVEPEKEGESAQALCYKCLEFEGRGTTAHRLVITEIPSAGPTKDDDKAPGAEAES